MKRALPALSPLVVDARYCHISPLRRGGAGPSVACAGVERCLPHFEVNRSDFPLLALEFVAEGAGSVEFNGHRHVLGPGHAFLYGPRIAHHIRTDPKKPMRKYFVDFVGSDARRMLNRLGLRTGEVRRVGEPNAARFLFDELIREGQRSGPRSAVIADSYLRLLLYKTAEIPATGDAAQSAAFATWQRCQQVMDDQFRTLKGLQELSRAAGVNASHLCRLFKRFGQGSPHAELSRRKMNHAASLLITTPELVKTIAQRVGYEDPLHFSRVFRRHFGRSPLDYQRTTRR